MVGKRLEEFAGTAMSPLAPTLRILHRPTPAPAAGQPGHHRRLPRHLPDAPRIHLQQKETRSRDLDFADLDAPTIAAFLTHLETEAAQQPTKPQRPPSGASTRSSGSPRSNTPNTPPDRAGPGDPAETVRSDRSVTFLTQEESKRSSPSLTETPGSVAATTTTHPRGPDRPARRRTHQPAPSDLHT